MMMEFLDKSWKLTLRFTDAKPFTKFTDGDYWVMHQVNLTADLTKLPQKFPDAEPSIQTFVNEVNVATGNGGLNSLIARKDHSWVCKQGYNTSVADNFNIDFSDVHVQAFTNATDFQTADMCKADQKTSSLIPIIVGACLAALVVIVLVAYLIGRARARREGGYQSV